MNIRSAGIEDIPVISDLARQIWPSAYNHILSGDQLEYMLRKFYNPSSLQKQMEEGQHFLLAFSGTTAVGFAAWQLKQPALARLHKLYVLPNFQGKNIGRQLLDTIIRASCSTDAKILELNVNRHNSALSFYKKFGFEINRTEDIDIGDGYFMNDYVMSLELKIS